MIVFVDLEHERLRSDATLWRFFSRRKREALCRIEALAGQGCAVARYPEVSPAALDALKPRAVVVGGNYTGFRHFSETDLAGLKEVLRRPVFPMLAICGGFQLLVQVHGGEVGPMDATARAHPSALEDTDTPYPPELRPGEGRGGETEGVAEQGFLPVRSIRHSPLFEGLPEEMQVYQLHGGEAKRLPPGWVRLAESDRCRVQAVTLEGRPLFGLQFHPECYDEDHPDGRRILQNFFRIAGGP